MDKEVEAAYVRDAVRILRTSLDLMTGGQPEFYRVAALQEQGFDR